MSQIVKLDYRGMKLRLSPEASVRYRKLAKVVGRPVGKVVMSLLKKTEAISASLFLPVK